MKRTYFFTAEWCMSCPPVKLNWMRAIRKYPDIEQHTVDMETEEGGAMAGKYGIRGLPTILLLNHDGSVHEMFSPAACGIMDTTDFDTKLFHWREE